MACHFLSVILRKLTINYTFTRIFEGRLAVGSVTRAYSTSVQHECRLLRDPGRLLVAPAAVARNVNFSHGSPLSFLVRICCNSAARSLSRSQAHNHLKSHGANKSEVSGAQSQEVRIARNLTLVTDQLHLSVRTDVVGAIMIDQLWPRRFSII